MVAYSFAPQFREQVSLLVKRQTVRAPRKRHARPGEPVQLYTAMRTRHCRKLVDHDPTCISVTPIEIAVSSLIDELIASIVVDGIPLARDEIEAFARDDGFAPELHDRTARFNMGAFWAQTHGYGNFSGVLIKWEPSA